MKPSAYYVKRSRAREIRHKSPSKMPKSAQVVEKMNSRMDSDT